MAEKAKKLKVEALRLGYYGYRRRRPGDVFMCEPKAFSHRWMKCLEGTPPPPPAKIPPGKPPVDIIEYGAFANGNPVVHDKAPPAEVDVPEEALNEEPVPEEEQSSSGDREVL